MAFIVVDNAGALIAGACTSPDVAGLVALLEEGGGAVWTIDDVHLVRSTPACGRRRHLPPGWGVVATPAEGHESSVIVDEDAHR